MSPYPVTYRISGVVPPVLQLPVAGMSKLMSSQTPRHGIDFVIEAETETQPRVEHGEQEPFRLLLMGDFSGLAERKPLAHRRPILVDRDNFEEVLAKLRPVAEVPAGRLTFIELDDFHPDVIYSRLPVFAALRETRERLADPSTFREAASDLLGPVEPTPKAPSVPKPADDLIGELLSEAAAAPKRSRADDDLQAFIRRAVQPYLVARPDPRAPELIRQVDDAAADMMRDIIHDPAFQSLEALWRTVLILVRTLETGPDLKIQLLDITKEEVRQDIAGRSRTAGESCRPACDHRDCVLVRKRRCGAAGSPREYRIEGRSRCAG